MKYISLVFIFLACKTISVNQIAYSFNNKGITKDAILDSNGNLYICGESSVYTSDKNTSEGNKDACMIIYSPDRKSNQSYSYGLPNQQERFERIFINNQHLFLDGFYGETKYKLLLKLDLNGNKVWGIESKKFTTFDHGHIGIDPSGNILIATKSPDSEPYEGFIHLIDSIGHCQWSYKLASIEIMQDIICTRDGNFLMSFKQKGAYIDGTNRQKYYMNSFHKINKSGAVIWSKRFNLPFDQIHDCYFHKLMEDANSNLYFLGRIVLVNSTKQEPIIVKTDSEGNILWSKIYRSSEEFTFKNGYFNEAGNLKLVADGYGKKGGILYLEVKPDGELIWANVKSTAAYEQVIAILSNKKSTNIVWDKLLNFAFFTVDPKGQSCYPDVKEIEFSQQSFPILLDTNRGNFEKITSDWAPVEIPIVIHNNIIATTNCD